MGGDETNKCQEFCLINFTNHRFWINRTKIISVSEQNRSRIIQKCSFESLYEVTAMRRCFSSLSQGVVTISEQSSSDDNFVLVKF
jgi:hypothetical protein